MLESDVHKNKQSSPQTTQSECTTEAGSPRFWEFREGGQAAGVHVSAHVYVHRSIGLGELCGCRDALVTQGRHWRPCDHGPGHA